MRVHAFRAAAATTSRSSRSGPGAGGADPPADRRRGRAGAGSRARAARPRPAGVRRPPRREASGRAGGHVSFGPGPRAVRLRARRCRCPRASTSPLAGPNVIVESARLIGESTDLTYRGRVSLSPRLAAEIGIAGQVDLAILDRHVIASDLGLEGHGQFRGTVAPGPGRAARGRAARRHGGIVQPRGRPALFRRGELGRAAASTCGTWRPRCSGAGEVRDRRAARARARARGGAAAGHRRRRGGRAPVRGGAARRGRARDG